MILVEEAECCHYAPGSEAKEAPTAAEEEAASQVRDDGRMR